MRTRNLDEAIDAVTRVYCPHTIRVTGSARVIDAVLEVERPTSQPLVHLSYGAPVHIDAEDFSRLFLMIHCEGGSAFTKQEKNEAEWRSGQTIPFSAGFATQLWFDREFVQQSIRLDLDQLESVCARWLGHPLERPLRFALRPFSNSLERVWQRTMSYLRSGDEGGLLLTGPAKRTFDEFLLTLILHQHPHNYSEEMTATSSGTAPGLVRRAERFMIDNADAPITVSDVSAELGISVRSLQAGFRQWRSTTPNAFLRKVRLQHVRDELLRGSAETNVTATALRFGFAHFGRFSANYRAAFKELPSATLRRGRG